MRTADEICWTRACDNWGMSFHKLYRRRLGIEAPWQLGLDRSLKFLLDGGGHKSTSVTAHRDSAI